MDTGNGYRGRIPFAKLHLTLEEQERCQELTFQLLDQSLRCYDERDTITTHGCRRHHSDLDSDRWKRLKTQRNASLYSERHHGGPRDLDMPGGHWENPGVLLAVGTIQGSLDDVMLGITTQSFGDIQLRSATIASQNVRGAMLAKLSGPTEGDPFKCMNIAWIVGEQKWPMNMLVRPRDFVNLTAFGVITRANGDRIGYEIVQPAQLPQCPALPKPMTRGKMMYGALYREQDGEVDVYIQLHVETMNVIVNAIMMNAMWNAALGFWKAPRLSDEKKLEWCIIGNMVKRIKQRAEDTELRKDSSPVCSSCKAVLALRDQDEGSRAANACAACGVLLCVRCRINRSIKTTTGRSKGAVTKSVAVVVCGECLERVGKESAAKIAWEQYQYRLMYSVTDTCSSSQPIWGLADDTTKFAWSLDQHFTLSDVFHNYSDGEDA